MIHDAAELFSSQPGFKTGSLSGCPFHWLCPMGSHVASSLGSVAPTEGRCWKHEEDSVPVSSETSCGSPYQGPLGKVELWRHR